MGDSDGAMPRGVCERESREHAGDTLLVYVLLFVFAVESFRRCQAVDGDDLVGVADEFRCCRRRYRRRRAPHSDFES